MLKFLLLCFVAGALGQIFDLGGFPTIYIGDEYKFEYDDGANIVIILSEMECFIVEAPDSTWDALFRDRQALEAAGAVIVRKIESKTGLKQITLAQATSAYHSRLQELQCTYMPIYVVSYPW